MAEKMKPVRPKKCRVCKEPFKPFQTTQVVCGIKCARSHAQATIEKKTRKDAREEKQRLKTRSEWIKDCQIWVNRYIRVRDEGRGCISCPTKSNDNDLLTGSRFDAGHYRSVGSSPSLRFYTLNIARQCVKCNRDLSGNTVSMRAGLVERYGKDKVEAIEAMQKPLKPDIEYCQRLIVLMRKKIKLYKKLRDK